MGIGFEGNAAVTQGRVMKLPNGHRAELGDKLAAYSLNPLQRKGGHKARVFASVFGITLENQEVLREAILRACVESNDAEARGDNGFGEVFVLRFPLAAEVGNVTIVTAWILRKDESFPRLTTCYIE